MNPFRFLSDPELHLSRYPSQESFNVTTRPNHQLTEYELDLIQQKIEVPAKNSFQTLKIFIVNSTDYKIQLTDYSRSVEWVHQPPEYILPKEKVLCGICSKSKTFEGFVTYSIFVNEEARIRLEWKIFYDNKTEPIFHCESTNWKYSGLADSFSISLGNIQFVISEEAHEKLKYELEEEDINNLHISTQFEKSVIRQLFFKVKPEKTDTQDRFIVTRQIFSRCFPKLNYDLVQKLFLVFGNNVEKLSFEKFLFCLFIMARGSVGEKARLTFRICNFSDNAKTINREDVQLVSMLLSESFSKSSDSQNYGVSPQFIEEFFQCRDLDIVSFDASRIQNEPNQTSLTLSEFVIRADNKPEIFECFGLFPYMNVSVLKPITDNLGENIPHSLSGILSESIEGISSYTPYLESRHCVLRQGFFAVYNPKDINANPPKYTIALHDFAVKEESMNRFIIEKNGLKYTFQAPNENERRMWVRALRANGLGGYRFTSFAPVRPNINTRWFIDGKEYFDALIPCLEHAKTRIFIADWFLSEQLYLSRNPKSKRLDQLLKAAAERGVKIYILLWNASSFAFSINPKGTYKQLMDLNKNICVQLHTSEQLVWSHHQKFVVVDDQIAFVGGIDLCFGRYDDGRYLISDPTSTTYPGRDYVNLCRETETNGPADQDILDRSTTPRMPWHDIMMQCDGLASKDVAFNFMQRWNFVKDRYAIETLLPLPVSHNRIDPAFYKSPYKECKCQILRSIGSWSCGVPTEKSIYNAYIETIQNAKHFIYIENQYFISSIDGLLPRNKILYAIYERIKKAIDNGETFRVIVLLPVYPAGKLNELTTRYVIKKVYKTISGIFKKLSRDYSHIKIEDYISFYSLRNHGRVGDKILTEQVYIHSKMMLVDDQVAIIGSANINDRSMRGGRDSEIAVYLEQPDCLVPSLMDGKPFKVSPFVQELRMNIWKRLLGINDDSFDELLKDPVTYYNLWRQRAIENSEIFKKVFPDIPENLRKLKVQGPSINDNTAKDSKSTFVGGIFLRGISSEPIALPSGEFSSKSEEELKKIKGFLILFPDKFLQDEKISLFGIPKNIFF